MPPKKSTPRDIVNGAIRQSPRKRKRDELELGTTSPSGHDTLNSTPVKSTPKGRTSANAPSPVAPQQTKKEDVVVDEPARTIVADQLKNTKKPKAEHLGHVDTLTDSAKPSIQSTTRRVKAKKAVDPPPSESDEEADEPKVKRKRKTKEEKEAENMPLAPRTKGLNMFVGAHVSIAKGVENAITNAVHIGGNALAMFLQSQRKWDNPDLKSENRDAFIHACSHHEYDQKQHVVPHGSYLVNLAAKGAEQAKKSYDHFVDDLKRCEVSLC